MLTNTNHKSSPIDVFAEVVLNEGGPQGSKLVVRLVHLRGGEETICNAVQAQERVRPGYIRY